MTRRRLVLLTAVVLMGAACGKGSASRPAPTPTPASPSPSARPDVERVSLLATGYGSFDLVTIPVAVLQNRATRHGAAQVVVRFQTFASGGRRLGAVETVPVNLGPGEQLPVTADCTDACVGVAAVHATVSVGSWTSAPGEALHASIATYRCQSCGGHQHGDVSGTVSVTRLAGGAAVTVFAACTDSGGGIVGGGSIQAVWPAGRSLRVDVPVLLRAPAVTCRLGASTGW